MHQTPEIEGGKPTEQASPSWTDRKTLATVTMCLVSAAAAWYLLRELAALLRPLLMAVFLGYVILPVHLRLRRFIPGFASVVVLMGISVGIFYLLALLIEGSVVELNEELPNLTLRAQKIIREMREVFIKNLPPWFAGAVGDTSAAEVTSTNYMREAVNFLANLAASVLADGLVVGFYLLFLLIEVAHFPQRVRSGFAGERAERILAVVGSINAAIASYIRVKVKASLILAVPVVLISWAFGVKFALLWGVLTFLCNFIPYIGSIIAGSLPILLAFLQLDFGWQPVAMAALIVSDHMLSAYVIEPSITGKAVGLSPLVILFALAFWGQCWGLAGMFLAVPLTVVLKIVMENVAFTRPVARLMGEE